jgi:hypothetical protein
LIANDKVYVWRVDATGEIGAVQGEKRIFCPVAVYFPLFFDYTQAFSGL